MPQPAVIVVQTADQLRLALLERLFRPPGVDNGVRLRIIQTAVRTAVERDEQQRPRLFGPDQRQDAPHGAEQLFETFAVAQDGVGRQQQRVEFAAHHVALELQAAVLLQHLRRQFPILGGHPFGRVEAAERFVKSGRQTVTVQTRIDVAAVRIERDHLVLPRLDREQRHVHAVLDADHHLLAAAAGLDDNRRLNPLELPLGDADPVALHQTVGTRRIDRQHIGVGGGHPAQVRHRLVREVGIVFVVLLADARQEVELGQEALHPVDLHLGGVYEDVVVEQRVVRADQFTVLLADLDIRRGKVLEEGLPSPDAAIEFALQRPGGISLVVALPRSGQNQHIPAHGAAVFPGSDLFRYRICPVPGAAFRGCHGQFAKSKAVFNPSLEAKLRPCRRDRKTR